eukprot:GHVS01043881.1.p1 GENE.GHVS01043881.1~~GHVS01043881.1.p1  ORF type:complete len:330 (+),score=54.84 GHVS01043881.1:387-1376(+)
MSDPITAISPEETNNLLVTMPRKDKTTLQKMIKWIKGEGEAGDVSSKLMCMICERLENDQLTEAFGIDDGFNMRGYFMVIHLWLIHKRLVMEPMFGYMVDNRIFKDVWDMFQHWMVLKEVPEPLFSQELQNVQAHMFGLMLTLDDALCRTDILPARINEAIWSNVYNQDIPPEDPRVVLLTKYVIRQLVHVLQMDRNHFLNADFVWADMIIPHLNLHVKSRVVPALSYKPQYNGYLPPAEDCEALAEKKKRKPQPQYFDHGPPINFTSLLLSKAEGREEEPPSKNRPLRLLANSKANKADIITEGTTTEGGGQSTSASPTSWAAGPTSC